MLQPPNPQASLKELLQSFAPIPDSEITKFIARGRIQKYVKGDFFVRTGEATTQVGFVYKGLFKAYGISISGQAYIRNFCSAGYFVGAYASVIRKVASEVSIETIEPAEVFMIEYSILENQFNESSAWQQLGRKLAENHFIERELKEYRLLACSAEERYDFFH